MENVNAIQVGSVVVARGVTALDRAHDALARLVRSAGWAWADDTRELWEHETATYVLSCLPPEVVAEARRERAGQLRLPFAHTAHTARARRTDF